MKLKAASGLVALLPSLALIPVLIGILKGLHIGGLPVLVNFLSSSLHPSLNATVLQSSWKGLQVTVYIAAISWLLSIFLGLILAIGSSKIIFQTIGLPNWLRLLIRMTLSFPRAIHELIWGLILLQLIGLSPWIAIIAIIIPYSSLTARVIGDQIDALDIKPLEALKVCGAKPLSALITTIIPKIIPVITSYGGYRFECALRGATLLGVFGLGGIGTELQLSFQSLKFEEMWTSLWMLAGLMFIVELLVNYFHKINIGSEQTEFNKKLRIDYLIAIITITFLCYQFISGDNYSNISWHPIQLPSRLELIQAANELDIIKLISNTLILTFLSAGIAIGTPPLWMMIWPHHSYLRIQSLIWGFFRLIPPPLSALILLLSTNPNIYVAALALGAHNMGVMGRLLKEGIEQNGNSTAIAFESLGAKPSQTWLYGCLNPNAPSYLAYSAYRTDVLIRQTAVLGLVGGTGLGWQLLESISSFNWAEIAVLIIIYAIITLTGESITDHLRIYWDSKNKLDFTS